MFECMEVRPATHQDLAAIEAVVQWSCTEAIGDMVPESAVEAEIQNRFGRSTLAEHILSRRLLVGGEADGLVELVVLVDEHRDYTELSLVVVPAHPSRVLDGRDLVSALRSMGWGGALVCSTALGHTVVEAFLEDGGFVPGEVTAGRLGAYDVFRRRWWLGPALSVAG